MDINSPATSSEPKNQGQDSVLQIDLLEILRHIWRAKLTILASIVVGIILAVVQVTFSKPVYTASTVLAPSDGSARSGAGSALSQYAGAASMLGIDVSAGGDNSDFTKYKSLLSSYRLAAALFAKDDMKRVFFGPTWDPMSRGWVRPTGVLFAVKNTLKGVLGVRQWQPPEPFEIQEYLKLHLSTFTDKLTGLLTLSINGDSPQEAVLTLKNIVLTTDDLMRQQAKALSRGRIAYLQDALSKTTQEDQRQAMITLMSMQEQRMMMSSVDGTYAISVIDPPDASPVPTSPNLRGSLTTDILAAILITMLFAVVYGHFLRPAAMKNPALPDWRRHRGLDAGLGSLLVLKRHHDL